MALKWHDAAKGKRDFKSMPEDALTIVARNRESFARFGWEPYLHNPKLKHRLHRIKVPTLLVWGENDGIVTPHIRRGLPQADPGCAARGDPAGRPPAADRAAAGVSR